MDKRWQWIGQIALVFGIVALTCGTYVYHVKRNIENDVIKNVQEALLINAEALQREVDLNLRHIRAIGEALSQGDYQETEARRFLTLFVRSHGYLRSGTADLNGRLRTTDGLSFEVKEAWEFREAMYGRSAVSEPFFDQASGAEVVRFTVPVLKDGEIARVLYVTKTLQNIQEEALQDFYGGKGRWFIVDGNGDFMFVSKNVPDILPGHNFYALLSQSTGEAAANALQKIRSDLDAGRGDAALVELDGDRKYVGYAPVPGHPGWRLIASVDYEVMAARSQSLLRDTFLICALLGVFIWIFAGYILYAERRKSAIVRQSKERLKNIAENIDGGVLMLRLEEELPIVYANAGFYRLVGYGKQQADAPQTLHDYVGRQSFRLLCEALRAESRSGDLSLELQLERNDGVQITALLRGRIAGDVQERKLFYCVLIDISEQKEVLRMLEFEKERYRILIEQSEDIILEIDLQSDMIFCSKKYEEKFGVDLYGYRFTHFFMEEGRIYPEDIEGFDRLYDELQSGVRYGKCEMRIADSKGRYIWCELELNAILDEEGNAYRLIGRLHDIDDRKREEETWKDLSRRDTLSRLYNKGAAEKLVDAYLKDEGRFSRHGFLFVDIDHFKEVNDTLGHLVGDQVIEDIGLRLRKLFREEDLIARFGGDEFCILMKSIPSREVLAEKAAALVATLERSYEADGQSCGISASVGLSVFPEDGGDYAALVLKADQAAYYAKKSGKNRYVFYSEALNCSGYVNLRRAGAEK